MLEKLSIKNYLLLKDVEIILGKGFNIITGETGAGKSILIDALSLLLGERADYSVIKKNKDKMIVEAELSINDDNNAAIENYLKENDIEVYDNKLLIIRRELTAKGVSRNFINDTPVTVNHLKYIGDTLVDIHSQNEHQSLHHRQNQKKLLDKFSISKDFEDLLSVYKKRFLQLTELQYKFSEAFSRKQELEQKRDYLSFQLQEINETDPKEKEDEELEKELSSSENIEQIRFGLDSAYRNLYEDNGSITERLKIVEKELNKIKSFNSEVEKIFSEIQESSTLYKEAGKQIQSIIDKLNLDPLRAEEIRERLFKLQFLKKKYGSDLKTIIDKREQIQKDFDLLENFDGKIDELKNQIEEEKKELYDTAVKISKARKDKAKTLGVEVVGVLQEVGLENAEFVIRFEHKTEETEKENTIKIKKDNIVLLSDGIDEVEFMVKINKGDEFTSLRKTVSGGEVSRIMLALKTALAGADATEILVFDEIDTGISGRIGQKAGKLLKRLSEYHQVISITHLAQIAALAEEHFVVSKKTEGDGTVTEIKPLETKEKVLEVAKLLSGEKVTDASIKSAKELIAG